MPSIQFRALQEEFEEYSKACLAGLETLRSLPDIDVGGSKKTQIAAIDAVRLYHYPAKANQSCRSPILICYALVNRPYILDLERERSFIKKLTDLGHNVYLIDWGTITPEDRYLSLDDYLSIYLDYCVEAAANHSGEDAIDLLGVCQGGVLSLCYSAIHPQRVRKLILLVTPIDFQTPDNLLFALTKHLDITLVTDTFGNIPGSLLNQTFKALMPVRLGIQKYAQLDSQLQTRKTAASYLRMEHWINDSPDQAGSAFLEFFQLFFKQNAFMSGAFQVGNRKVDLATIQKPILNIYGLNDHIVPPAASSALAHLVTPSAYQELQIRAGHIGLMVSPSAAKRVTTEISAFLQT